MTSDQKEPRLPMTQAEFEDWVKDQPSAYELVEGVPIPLYGEVRGDLITSGWQALHGSLRGKGTDPDRVRTIDEISGAAATDDKDKSVSEARAARWLEENKEAIADFNEMIRRDGLPLDEILDEAELGVGPRLTIRSGAPGRPLKLPPLPEEGED